MSPFINALRHRPANTSYKLQGLLWYDLRVGLLHSHEKEINNRGTGLTGLENAG